MSGPRGRHRAWTSFCPSNALSSWGGGWRKGCCVYFLPRSRQPGDQLGGACWGPSRPRLVLRRTISLGQLSALAFGRTGLTPQPGPSHLLVGADIRISLLFHWDNGLPSPKESQVNWVSESHPFKASWAPPVCQTRHLQETLRGG